MNAPHPISRDLVIEHSQNMPSFPRVVTQILETIEDPDGNIQMLANSITHDPLIAARVLSAANTANARLRRDREVSDIGTATALIGMTRVREIALISSLGSFVKGLIKDPHYINMWNHCVSTGVCCEEIALYIDTPVSLDLSLIAGLLHDIGQFWFYAYDPEAYSACREKAVADHLEIEEAERLWFGVDHTEVGFWLTEHWGLPDDICQAIRGHHSPDSHPLKELSALLHVAEVLSNALDLTNSREVRVKRISSLACRRLGLTWSKDIQPVFGRIEARSRHANQFFSIR